MKKDVRKILLKQSDINGTYLACRDVINSDNEYPVDFLYSLFFNKDVLERYVKAYDESINKNKLILESNEKRNELIREFFKNNDSGGFSVENDAKLNSVLKEFEGKDEGYKAYLKLLNDEFEVELNLVDIESFPEKLKPIQMKSLMNFVKKD